MLSQIGFFLKSINRPQGWLYRHSGYSTQCMGETESGSRCKSVICSRQNDKRLALDWQDLKCLPNCPQRTRLIRYFLFLHSCSHCRQTYWVESDDTRVLEAVKILEHKLDKIGRRSMVDGCEGIKLGPTSITQAIANIDSLKQQMHVVDKGIRQLKQMQAELGEPWPILPSTPARVDLLGRLREQAREPVPAMPNTSEKVAYSCWSWAELNRPSPTLSDTSEDGDSECTYVASSLAHSTTISHQNDDEEATSLKYITSDDLKYCIANIALFLANLDTVDPQNNGEVSMNPADFVSTHGRRSTESNRT